MSGKKNTKFIQLDYPPGPGADRRVVCCMRQELPPADEMLDLSVELLNNYVPLIGNLNPGKWSLCLGTIWEI